MKRKQIFNLSITISLFFLLYSCGVVEMSGTMTRKTGEVMADYSKKNDGAIGKMAGFGGKINTAVGTTVENIAQNGKSNDSDKSNTEQFFEANKAVLKSATDSVKEKDPAEYNIVLKAQKKLQSLGYDPGVADGIMGNKTRLAIGKYQQSEFLDITNSLDEQTLNALKLNPTE